MAPIFPDILTEIRSNSTIQYTSTIQDPKPCYYFQCLGEKLEEKNSYWNSKDFQMDVTESIVLALHIVFVAFLTWSSYKNKNKEKNPINILFLGNSFAIIFRAALWLIQHFSPSGVYSRHEFYKKWLIIFTYSTFFINFFHLILVPIMSLSISLKLTKRQLIFQFSLLVSTILLSFLGAYVEWKNSIDQEYILIVGKFDTIRFFFDVVNSWVYFLPLLFTLLFPMVSYFNRKQNNSKKQISPDDFKFTTIVMITGFLYAIPITVAYLDNNDFMNLFNSYQNVHLYHYAPEIVVPVTVMVLSIEWKKKVVPVVTIN